jgi:hypothetical protein
MHYLNGMCIISTCDPIAYMHYISSRKIWTATTNLKNKAQMTGHNIKVDFMYVVFWEVYCDPVAQYEVKK